MNGLRYRFFIYLILVSAELYSQPSSTIYSMFGIGNIENQGFGVSRALGGTGLALSSEESLNNLNPASYSGIDTLSVHFEFGTEGKYSKYKDYKTSKEVFDGSLTYLALGLRLNKWWATSFGIAPYSSVGYSIKTIDKISGDVNSFMKTTTGSGGLTNLYFSNSFSVLKGFSLGVNASFLFGSINYNEKSDLFQYSLDEKSHFSSLIMDYGLQYSFKFRETEYSVGLVFGNEKNLQPTNEIFLINPTDTLSITIENEENIVIPRKTGAGILINHKDKFKAALDYTTNNWQGADFENDMIKTVNSEKYCMGFEYNPRASSNKGGLSNLSYRLGGYYDKSYLIINNQNITTKAITFGVGIPFRSTIYNTFSTINVSVELGEEGTLENKLIKSNYLLLHLNLSLHDLWFIKRKYD